MRILFAGGGTGGHIYPALAVADYIKSQYPECELLYVGTEKGLEMDIVGKRGDIPFHTIRVEGLPRKISPALVKAGMKAFNGCLDARKVIRDFRPDVVVGTGGYVCGPIVLAAKLAGVPALIHEQNALPGITNKLLSKWVDCVMVNFAESKSYFAHPERVKVTGLPVRGEVLTAKKAEGLAYFGFSEDKVTLLVSGGSRGAKSINLAMARSYPKLLEQKNLQIIHLTGNVSYDDTLAEIKKQGVDLAEQPQIVVKPYLNEMQYALAAADFCVGRAGATYLAELTACGKASILIPYPFAAENHQQYNAQALVDQGAAKMILDKELNSENLSVEIINLLENTIERKKMAEQAAQAGKKDALAEIAALITKYC